MISLRINHFITVALGAFIAALLAVTSAATSPFLPLKPEALFGAETKLPVIQIRLSNQYIIDQMHKAGFTDITNITHPRRRYILFACKNGLRYRIRLSRIGVIRKQVQIGPCVKPESHGFDHGRLGGPKRHFNDRRHSRGGLRPPQVRRSLRTRGFSRILFLDHQLPIYVVEACRYNRNFELRLNRFARIMRKTDLGRCQTEHLKRGYGPREVKDILQRRGYREIDFFDRSLPGYGVIACKRGQKFRLRLNRFAEVKRRRRTGFCRPPQRLPRVVDDYDVINDDEINGTGQIDPETCQSYLNILVRRNRIHFNASSATLRRRSHGLLRRLAKVMDRCRSSRIEIAGHTDSDGSHESNHDLSHDRAQSVARFLFREGISRRRIKAIGYGEERPLIRHEHSERDRARNRRIEFTVLWGDKNDRNYR